MAQRALTVSNPAAHIGRPMVIWSSAANAVLNGDTTDPVEIAQYDAMSVQFTGTPGAGFNAAVEISHDGTTWFGVVALNSTSAIAVTVLPAIATLPYEAGGARFVRARITAGDGTTAVTVSFFGRK